MRENRLSGSEGGAILIQSSLPEGSDLSLRDESDSPLPDAASLARHSHPEDENGATR